METSTKPNEVETEKKAPQTYNVIVLEGPKDYNFAGKSKTLLSVKNLSGEPPSFTVFIEENRKELINGLELKPGSRFQMNGFMNSKVKEKDGRTYNNYSLTLLSTPVAIMDQKLEVKGHVVSSKGIAELKGDGYQYKKLEFVLGVPGTTATEYFSVHVNEKYIGGASDLKAGDTVFVEGYKHTETWKNEEKEGVNQIIRVNNPIIIGEENIQKHLSNKEKEHSESKSHKR